MSKAPKLRFKEFSGDWEEKKVQELCDTITDYVAAGSFESIRNNVTYYNNDNFAQLIRTIDLKNNFKNKDFIFVDENAFNFLYRVNLNENSIILPNIGANIGESYYLEPNKLPNKNNVLGPNAILLKSKYNNTKYVYYLFNTKKFHKQLVQMIGASGQPKFNKTELKQMKFYIPSKEEQDKIASFFSLIDDKISLQGEKVEALKDYKKGMMQKIFSRELRFKDDEGRDYPEWEEKKITEVAKTSIGLVTTMTENYVEDGVKLIRNSDIKENKIKKDNLINLDIEFAAQNEHRKLKINDVVTVHTGDIGTSAVIDEDMDGCLGFATLNTRPDNNIIDSHYLCHYFNSFRNKKYAIRMSTGDGRSNYNLKDFNNANILIPCIEEQKKIVNVLSNIDLKLDKEQEKLDSLNEYKKGLLQQMFV